MISYVPQLTNKRLNCELCFPFLFRINIIAWRKRSNMSASTRIEEYVSLKVY